ncbi:MAG: hypothetical protein KGY76_03545 [Candidatus Thermoplasmatota archaeon]|nr:hypothetical protein [Candidatus Thermoplasmatota archaeon]
MVELDEDKIGTQMENLTCPDCGKGWMVRDWGDMMVCQNCGSKFEIEELIKNISGG